MQGTPPSVGPALPLFDRHSRDGAERPARSGRLLDVAVLGVLTAVAALAYILTRAPLYNPPGTIDPWFYTALWTNFHQLYHSFVATYYASRIPWIVPGYLANLVFSAKLAYWVVHVPFFLAGGIALYIFCRRWLGVAPAACGYIGLIGSQLYWDGQRWDYEEAAIVPFMLLTYLFGTPRTANSRLRVLSFAFAGFFGAAMVTTRITDVIYACGLPFFYWVSAHDLIRVERLSRVMFDTIGFAFGVGALLVAGGTFATLNGGPFWYVGAQIHVLSGASTETNQLPVHVWFPQEPYFFAPLFVVIVTVLVLFVGKRMDADARRFQIAAASWLGLSYVFVVAWEFLGGGFVFELGYYFSSFLAPLFVGLVAIVAGMVGRSDLRRAAWGVLTVVLVTAGTFATLLWFFWSDQVSRASHVFGKGAYLVMLIFMTVSLVFVLVVRLGRLRSKAVTVTAAAACVLSVGYGIDASLNTVANASSDPTSGDLYDLGQDLTGYLHGVGYSDTLPTFWYDLDDPYADTAIGSLQSLWMYNYTYVGDDMPARTQDFRSRMSQFLPADLVLLCGHASCPGAARSLAAGGYEPKLASRKLLRSGSLQIWVVIYRLLRPPTP